MVGLNEVGLRELIDEVLSITESRKSEILQSNLKRTRVCTGIARPWLAKHFGFSLLDYYRVPIVCLRGQLLTKILRAKELDDDNLIRPVVGVDLGVALEPSLFGVEPVFQEGADPTFGDPVIRERADLDKLELPDFFQSGYMPHIHRMYEEIQGLVDGDLQVTFPGFARGPWSVACMLRGFTQLYMDLIDAPEFVHRLMQFITDSKIKYEKDRAKFLGVDLNCPDRPTWKYVYADYREVDVSDLYNDEVDGALFSPATYEEFIFPYEEQIAREFGGIRYYHSCGNLTSFAPIICKLPRLRILHLSAWTDLDRVLDLLPPGVVVQQVFHINHDVIEADFQMKKDKVQIVVEQCRQKDVPVWLCVDTYNNGPLESLKEWIAAAREVLREALFE